MNRIQELKPGDDVTQIANQLPKRLRDAQNGDILLDFPNTFAKYNGDYADVFERFTAAAETCETSKREIFVAYHGVWLAGMMWVQRDDAPPAPARPEWPNISLFVCQPFRGKGIGTLLMERAVRAVDENFDGTAWTKVRKNNDPSNSLITRAGFIRVAEPGSEYVYLYPAATAAAITAQQPTK